MHGSVDSPDDHSTRATGPTGRHRGRRLMPAPVVLGLSVAGLVGALGLGSALLPASLTGPGTPAESPAAAVAALAPGAGGGAPGDGAARTAGPSAFPSPSASPSPRRAATPKVKPGPSRTPRPEATRRSAAPVVGSGLTGQENEVIRLVNVERDRAGCGALRLDTRLRKAIRLHVAELGTHGDLYISHVSDDGRTFVDRARAQGYGDPGGENMARGQRDAADVMTSWMNSAGHRANILNCGFTAIGVGVTKGVDRTLVWGQLFGRS